MGGSIQMQLMMKLMEQFKESARIRSSKLRLKQRARPEREEKERGKGKRDK
jgi:hypothetical protein